MMVCFLLFRLDQKISKLIFNLQLDLSTNTYRFSDPVRAEGNVPLPQMFGCGALRLTLLTLLISTTPKDHFLKHSF